MFVCLPGVRVDIVTALEPTVMDTTAMVSMNDMPLRCVCRLMLGLSSHNFLFFLNATKFNCIWTQI